MKAILTLNNGRKETLEVIPHDKPIFLEQMEKDLMTNLNRMLVNTPNRVVKCHLMRN